MRRKATTGTFALACALLAATVAAGLAFAGAGDELFEQALRKERVEGDLKAAIEIYRRIATEHAADRPVAARALVQLGKGQEKLGQAEARAAYERVLADYADQPEAVSEAKARLRQLAGETQPQPGFAARKVAELGDLYGSVSPDGRHVTFVNWDKGNLALFDSRTGERRDLTDEGTWQRPMQFSDMSVWSPDSRQIAYLWFIGAHSELRLVGAGGGKPRTVAAFDDGVAAYPLAWNKDGKSIWVSHRRVVEGKPQLQIASVDATSGAVTFLKPFDARPPWPLPLPSPDGRHFVYAHKAKDTDRSDIRILTLESGVDRPLIEHPANDEYPVWSPDGKRVVFSSDRGGRPGLWHVPVEDGKAAGDPHLIVEGRYAPMGFIDDGTLYCSTSHPASNIYVAAVDVAKGTLGEPRVLNSRFDGRNHNPFWSPDGSTLAYVSRRDAGAALVLRDVAAGTERDVAAKNLALPQYWDDPQWTRDGSSILTIAGAAEKGWGLHLIRVDDGATEKVLAFEADPPAGYFKVFTADGNLIYARRSEGKGDGSEIVRRDLKTGGERVIRRSARGIYRMALSPDGSRLAHFEADEQWWSALVVTSVADGSAKTLWEADGPAPGGDQMLFPRPSRPAWLPDGNRLLVLTVQKDRSQQFQIVDARTGEHRPIGPAFGANEYAVRHPSLHPDGTRVAFARGGRIAEVWAMTNVFARGPEGAVRRGSP